MTIMKNSTSVDPLARRSTTILLKRVSLGRITTDEFECGILEIKTSDPVVLAIYRTIYALAGDFAESLASEFPKYSEMRRKLCRWILFLRSDYEYKWPQDKNFPGLRDVYCPTWLDKICYISESQNKHFMGHGDYHVWPFLREIDFIMASKRHLGGIRGHTSRHPGSHLRNQAHLAK